MKKPDKTSSSSRTEVSRDQTPLMLKKEAAEPGVIAQADTGPGDGAGAMATGGEIKPIGSSLLGDGTGQHPAAERKADAGPADAPKDACLLYTSPSPRDS